MKVTRHNAVALPLLIVLLAMLAACGSQSAEPAAGRSPSVTAPATATPGTGTASGSGAPAPSPSTQVVSSRVAYQWHWPNDAADPGRVSHIYPVPPVPELTKISVGSHPAGPGGRAFDRMSFTFSTAFPSYRFEFTEKLISDGSGKVVPLKGLGVLRIVFTQAQAHTAGGTSSTITSEPARDLGLQRMVDYSTAGDFEGVLTYGIGISWLIPHSNPQIPVRAYEVETISASGEHRYTVAFDISTASSG